MSWVCALIKEALSLHGVAVPECCLAELSGTFALFARDAGVDNWLSGLRFSEGDCCFSSDFSNS